MLEKPDGIESIIDQDTKERRQKKILIIGIVIGGVLIAGGVLCLILYLAGVFEPSPVKGQILCTYSIGNAKEINILGENFGGLSTVEIYYKDKKIEKSTKFTFDEDGDQVLRFDVLGDLNMSYMYQNVTELKKVVMTSEKEKGKITSMISTFEECILLEGLSLSGFNMDSVESITRAFYGTKIDITQIEGLDTKNIKDMSYMFAFSTSNSLDLTKINTNQATNMSYMFYECNYLETLNIANINTQNVVDMSHMFEGCNDLKELKLENLEHFDTSKVTTMESMFKDMYLIEDLDLSKFNTEKVESISFIFSNCYKLKNLSLPPFNNLIDIKGAFQTCGGLTSLSLSQLKTNKVVDMSFLFEGCYTLESIDFANFDTTQVTMMKKMFKDCHALKSLSVKNFQTSNVNHMGHMFENCKSLESLDLTSFSTENVKDMDKMFSGDGYMKTLDLTTFNTLNCERFKSIMDNCVNLTVSLKNSTTSNIIDEIPKYVTINYVDQDYLDLYELFDLFQ